ncbi:MAG: hypothetical protein ACT4N2_16035 [Hyphomicrobium sp.]
MDDMYYYYYGLAAVLIPTLATVVVYVLIAYFVYRWWRRKKAIKFGNPLLPAGDATRYALASVVLEGSGFRREIIDMARHRFQAKAPELGLDFPLVLAACLRFEREDRIYNWLIFGTTVLALPFLLSFVNPFLVLSLFGQFGMTIGTLGMIALLASIVAKAVRDVRRLAPFYRETYDPAQLRQELMPELGDTPPPYFGPADNVICYGLRNPFIGLGDQIGAWQVTVELDRGTSQSIKTVTNGNGHHDGGPGPSPVHMGQMLQQVDESVRRLNLPNLQFRFPLFVSGTEVAQFSTLLPDKFSLPRRYAENDLLGHFWYATDPRARSYRWYVITDWNGELVFSYLLRMVQTGNSLAIETAQLILAPIAERYRKVDSLRYRGILGWISTVAFALLRSPLTVLHSITGAFQSLSEAMGLARLPDSDAKKEISRSQAFNYGALTTLREQMASKNYHIYFQGIDGRQHFRAINQRVLNSVTQSLIEAGVDVTSLVGQSNVVINSSVVNSSVVNNDQSIKGDVNFGVINSGTMGNVQNAAAGAIGQAAAAAAKGIGR